MKIQKVG